MAAHENIDRKLESKPSSDRSFGLVMTCAFTIIALWPLRHGQAPHWWVLGPSAVLLTLSFVKPALLHPVNRLWTKLGLLLHKVVNPVITGLLFYLVVTPTGFFMRVCGKDTLRLHFDPQTSSYWIKRDPPGPTPESMRNQF